VPVLPSLILIAGANGAGKSTSSASLLEKFGINAFDYDYEFHSRWKKFSFDPIIEQGVRDSVSEIFLDQKDTALKNKTNFAFETNYHHSSVVKFVDEFTLAGFITHLIFLCLPNKQVAIERVRDRVLKGGHPVDQETIHERFEKGLAQLDVTFDKFDLVSLFLSEEYGAKRIAWLQPKLKKIGIFNPIPNSIKQSLPRLEKFIQLHKQEP
jgi:predicted ABC-type ATPase